MTDNAGGTGVLKTKSGLPRYCTYATDRHGKRRVRFQRPGFSTYIAGTPWSDEFMRQYATALDGVKAQKAEVGSERTTPGSFNALVVSYYRSPEFRGLATSTQAVRRNIIERFRAKHGHKPVKDLERRHLKDVLGARAATPEAANNLLKVLRLLLAHAVDNGMITHNPALGIKKYKSRNPDGIHTWTDEETAKFEARHPIGTNARLAMALALCTGQRRGDIVRMGWQHVQGDSIAVRQEKTTTPLWIPLHPELRRALKATPRSNLTFLVTQFGKPFTPAGFGGWFRRRCNEARLRQCSIHGLRKAAATRLAEVGCTAREIMAVTGHRSLSEVERYTRAADQRRLAREAMNKLTRGQTEPEQNLSNLTSRLDKG